MNWRHFKAIILWLLLIAILSAFLLRVKDPMDIWDVRNQLYQVPLLSNAADLQQASDGSVVDIIGMLGHRDASSSSDVLIRFLRMRTDKAVGNMSWSWEYVNLERNPMMVKPEGGGSIDFELIDSAELLDDMRDKVLSDYTSIPYRECSAESEEIVAAHSKYEHCREYFLANNKRVYLRGVKSGNSLEQVKILSLSRFSRSRLFWYHFSIYDAIPTLALLFLIGVSAPFVLKRPKE